MSQHPWWSIYFNYIVKLFNKCIWVIWLYFLSVLRYKQKDMLAWTGKTMNEIETKIFLTLRNQMSWKTQIEKVSLRSESWTWIKDCFRFCAPFVHGLLSKWNYWNSKSWTALLFTLGSVLNARDFYSHFHQNVKDCWFSSYIYSLDFA